MGRHASDMARRFSADKSGSPALEFAIIAPLFFAAVFGTFEVGRALHEKNRITSAAAIAARALIVDSSATNSQITAVIEGKLAGYDPADLTITLTDQSIAGQTFKKIEISYTHDLLVKFSSHLSDFTLTATRYAPVT